MNLAMRPDAVSLGMYFLDATVSFRINEMIGVCTHSLPARSDVNEKENNAKT